MTTLSSEYITNLDLSSTNLDLSMAYTVRFCANVNHLRFQNRHTLCVLWGYLSNNAHKRQNAGQF